MLTNLSEAVADALTVSDLYRNCWKIETAFQKLEKHLHSEINTLGYPQAALFGFCLALVAFNLLQFFPNSKTTPLYSFNHFDNIGNMDKSTAIAVLGALAQDTRLDIFRHLAQTEPQPAGQVGERFGLPLATLSFHLKTLQQAGLLACRREGRQLIYQARCDVIVELMAYLTEHCCNLPAVDPTAFIPLETLTRKSTAMNQGSVYHVLFLCTGNSARSVLAEATMNHLSQGRFRAFSAGSFPAGQVHPLTLKLLELQGLPTAGLRSKSWNEFATPDAPPLDFVFTVCDNAAHEVCPVWPGQPMSAHWGVEDPTAVEGNESQKMLAFRKTLRELENRIKIFMNLPIRSLDKIKLQSRLDEIGKTVLENHA